MFHNSGGKKLKIKVLAATLPLRLWDSFLASSLAPGAGHALPDIPWLCFISASLCLCCHMVLSLSVLSPPLPHLVRTLAILD